MNSAGEDGLECMVWGRVAYTPCCEGGRLRVHGVGEGGLECMVWGRVV